MTSISYPNPQALADAIIRDVGPKIVLGLPLGLGKANHIANALYARAVADPSIDLTIFTALTLEKPRPTNELEKRFSDPLIARLFGGYPDLDYALAQHANRLPPNVHVTEFFFLAGQWLHSPAAQQHYISANYTHAFDYLLERNVNVVAQLVARREQAGQPRYSLSCNTDITVDLLKARNSGRANFRIYGQVNSELPFMSGDGDLAADEFAGILDTRETDFPLFAPPAEPITDPKYAIGLHCASLVPDGGTLQIGIGQVGDALAQGLILRHRKPESFEALLAKLSSEAHSLCQSGKFERGLYGISEMFFEAFLGLITAGIIKREVDGALLHAAFFLGPKSFYTALRDMSPADRDRIQMKAVSFTNELYGDEAAKREARVGARFVNNAMMATLLGSVISDGLENGAVVSGVGGQYNFVAQAFALKDARSVIALESTRFDGRRVSSNIRWSYGHETIPRHLRDIIVTEYGVADLRGRSDEDVIDAMLRVADSRFQMELMRRAKDAGKLPRTYEIPKAFRENLPERIVRVVKPYRGDGSLPDFPFGSDFTDAEQRLIPALLALKQASRSPAALAQLAWRGIFASSDAAMDECLRRLDLDKPLTWRDRAYQMLLRGALSARD